MKTSTLLIALLILNSGVLAGQISSLVIGGINPFVLGGIELFLGASYYAHRIIKDVRNVFDVEVKL